MTKEDYLKLPKERLAELLAEKDLENKCREGNCYDWPLINPQEPCYAPNGICANPFHDCINCPKQFSSEGIWTTNTCTLNPSSDDKQKQYK